MDRRERVNDLNEMLLAAFQGWQSNLWTALPGYVTAFDPAKKTVSVQPTIKGRIRNVDGTYRTQPLPLLLDCPVFFPSGGGYTLTFPIVAGDECLVVFASRCIDAWWYSGGIQDPAMVRMHDLSDGFVFVGISSVPKVPANISITSVQLRSDDGATKVDLINGTITVAATNVTVNSTNANVNATGVATITSPSIILKNTGAALKKLVNDTFFTLFNNHVHSGVSAGTVNTGTPTVTSVASNATSTVQAE